MGEKVKNDPQIQISHPKIGVAGNFQVKCTILNFLAFWPKKNLLHHTIPMVYDTTMFQKYQFQLVS